MCGQSVLGRCAWHPARGIRVRNTAGARPPRPTLPRSAIASTCARLALLNVLAPSARPFRIGYSGAQCDLFAMPDTGPWAGHRAQFCANGSAAKDENPRRSPPAP